jgi:hypothetical protein
MYRTPRLIRASAFAWLVGLSLFLVATVAPARTVAQVARTTTTEVAEPSSAALEYATARSPDLTRGARMVRVSTKARPAPASSFAVSPSSEVLASRLDNVALLSSMSIYGSSISDPLMSNPVVQQTEMNEPHARTGYGLPLPEPDGWAAVIATIALGLFFFLRRIV